MLVLIHDNNIVGVTEQRDNIPDGFTVAEYPSLVDVSKLYYDITTQQVQLIPDRPTAPEGSRVVWDGQKWNVITNPVFRVTAKEQYIGSALYRWAKGRSENDPKVRLLHITAMCCDAADVRDELISTVKELRDIRNATANSPN